MEVTSTTKGKPMMHYLGYAYRKHRENGKGVVSWLCQKQKSKRCTGRLKSCDGSVLQVTDHQCGPPDEAALCVQKQISKVFLLLINCITFYQSTHDIHGSLPVKGVGARKKFNFLKNNFLMPN